VASGAIDLAVGLDYPDNPIPLDPALRTMRLLREPFELAAPTGALTTHEKIQLADPRTSTGSSPARQVAVYGCTVRHVCRRHKVEPRVREEDFTRDVVAVVRTIAATRPSVAVLLDPLSEAV